MSVPAQDPAPYTSSPAGPPASGLPGSPAPDRALPPSAPPGTSQHLVRRPGLGWRVAGSLLVPVGVVFSGWLLVTTLRDGAPVVLALGFAVLGLGLSFLGLTLLRYRTVFDATGIHSRGVLTTTHLPWPDSRAAFVVDVSTHYNQSDDDTPHPSRRRRTSGTSGAGRDDITVQGTIEVMAGSRTARLAAPRVSASGGYWNRPYLEAGVRSRLEAEVDEIWAWALACGYVHEVLGDPLRGVPAPGGLLAADVPAWGARGGGSGAGGAPASAGASGSGWDVTGSGAGTVPADQTLVGQEPLVLRERRTSWLPPGVAVIVLLAVLELFAYAFISSWDAVEPGSLTGPGPRLPGLLRAALVVVPVLVAAGLLFPVYRRARTRLTLTREGLDHVDGLRVRRIPWPASRSSVFVSSRRCGGRTTTEVRVLGPCGASTGVPGMRWRSRDEREALLLAVGAAETVWAWAASRGVVRDDGAYHPAADAGVEQDRVVASRRIDYLFYRDAR